MEEVQIDEFWGFVGKKEKNLTAEEKILEEFGDMWTFTAIIPGTKLIFAHLSGKRTKNNARKAIEMIKKRSDGTIPYLSTDGNEDYIDSILSVYGELNPENGMSPPEDLCYTQVIKKIEGSRCTEVKRKIIFGNKDSVNNCLSQSPVSTAINTAFIERSNLTVRQHNKRVERKTQGFSKLKYFFKKQMSLSIAYYNFCLPHGSLKYFIEDKTVINTPVMETGLTDHVWSMEELLSFPINYD